MVELILAKADSTDVIIWVAILIAIALAGGLLILLVRKRMLAKESAGDPEGMMQSLRKLRDSGAMTPQEYDAARKAMVARLTGAKDGPRPEQELRPRPEIPPDSGKGVNR